MLLEKYAHVVALEDLLPLSLRIVRYKMMGLHQKRTRHGEYTQVPADELPLADPRSNQAVELERREQIDRLKAALAEMGERCRELFRLKLEGKTFPEIQSILGAASINTVYTWDFRCRKQMLELMGGGWETKR